MSGRSKKDVEIEVMQAFRCCEKVRYQKFIESSICCRTTRFSVSCAAREVYRVCATSVPYRLNSP